MIRYGKTFLVLWITAAVMLLVGSSESRTQQSKENQASAGIESATQAESLHPGTHNRSKPYRRGGERRLERERRGGHPNSPPYRRRFRGGQPRPPMWDRFDSPGRMSHLRQENPELAESIEKIWRVRNQIEKLTSRYAKNRDPKRAKNLKKRLRPLLEKEFDLDLKRQEMEIKMLERRIEQLKYFLKRKEQHRPRFIDRRLEEELSGTPRRPPLDPDQPPPPPPLPPPPPE